MFLTITIDTAQQKKSKLKMVKKSAFVTKGWRATPSVKKRSFWQRISSWKKKIGGGIYKLGDQTALF
jgi:hypothetical protein